jgi:cyclopropane-fatty-acyl-phospholipid synthase
MLFMRLLTPLIQAGTLTVIDASGQGHTVGNGDEPKVTIRLHDRSLHWRLFVKPDLYLGEAYMQGTLTIDGGDIYRLLDLVGRNLQAARRDPSQLTALARLFRPFGTLWRRFEQANDTWRARRHAAHHYELTDQLYDLFLDPDRIYSCAYFYAPDDPLERAQEQKMRHIAAKLQIGPDTRVLDIGCGWGALGFYLAEVTGARVTGINVAASQVAVARERAASRGLADHVDFQECDYRHVKGVFDRIVSVGFLEHVGIPYMETFFNRVAACLADDGVALIHFIGRPDGPGRTNAWLRKYIFPGGYSPALSEVVTAIERAGLWITDIEVLRMHYAWTLRHWRHRFLAHWQEAKALYDERFCRMWEFYLAACEMTFRYTPHAVFQVQLAKRVDALPYRRDYMVEAERAFAGALVEQNPAALEWHRRHRADRPGVPV